MEGREAPKRQKLRYSSSSQLEQQQWKRVGRAERYNARIRELGHGPSLGLPMSRSFTFVHIRFANGDRGRVCVLPTLEFWVKSVRVCVWVRVECQSLATLWQRQECAYSQRECAGITDLLLSFTRTRIALTEAECAYSQRLSFRIKGERGLGSCLCHLWNYIYIFIL